MRLERETIALCRCGKSRLRPCCDGTHKLIGFEAPCGPKRWPALFRHLETRHLETKGTLEQMLEHVIHRSAIS